MSRKVQQAVRRHLKARTRPVVMNREALRLAGLYAFDHLAQLRDVELTAERLAASLRLPVSYLGLTPIPGVMLRFR